MRGIVIALIFIIVCCSLLDAQKTNQIQYRAKSFEGNEQLGPDIRVMKDEVVFTHEGLIMYCDSAYMNSKANQMEAFSNVHLIQGDTLHLFSDYLKYDGNTKIAQARKNVKMIDDSTILYTENLDYDRNQNIAYYFDNGRIESGQNILTSEKGYYYTLSEDIYFKTNAVLVNPDYNMFSDTLKYNSKSKIAYFMGPSTIISDSLEIYGKGGFYNTNTNTGHINKDTYVTNLEQIMYSDSIYFDRNKNYAEAFNNIEMKDSANKLVLYGNYGMFYTKEDKGFLTDSAVLEYYTKYDTLFMHADTLRTFSDSIKNKYFIAYNHAKAYKKDMQMMCDSLFYSGSDSVIYLFKEPVLWNEENQLTGDVVKIYITNASLDFAEIEGSSFIASQHDNERYNQIKGRYMRGHFNKKGLYKVFVKGNGETIYFPVNNKEEEKNVIGVNKAKGSSITITLDQILGTVKKIKLVSFPEGTLKPEENLEASDKTLKGFKWLEEYRPKSKHDIFKWK